MVRLHLLWVVHAEIGLAFGFSLVHLRSVGSSNSSSRRQDFQAECENLLGGGVPGGGGGEGG